jgi:hypothetical protein
VAAGEKAGAAGEGEGEGEGEAEAGAGAGAGVVKKVVGLTALGFVMTVIPPPPVPCVAIGGLLLLLNMLSSNKMVSLIPGLFSLEKEISTLFVLTLVRSARRAISSMGITLPLAEDVVGSRFRPEILDAEEASFVSRIKFDISIEGNKEILDLNGNA